METNGFLLSFVSFVLGGASVLVCAQTVAARTAFPAEPGSAAASPASASVPADSMVANGDRYRVQPDDILSIGFPLSPELNQTVAIQPDGYVSLLSVGSVLVRGLTVPELVQAVKTAYAGKLHDPIIDIDLKDFQKPVFYISGQVSKPGQYDLRYKLSVMQAIAIGGGLAQTARTQVVLMHRVSTEWAEVKVLNLRKVTHGKALDTDAQVMPGDLIFVPEKAIVSFRKYVPYGLGLSFSPANSNVFY